MFDDQGNEFEYSNQFRLGAGRDDEKVNRRLKKAVRTNRAAKKATPGSARLRRNKHWSW